MIGSILAERYRIDARIGQGGMGTVYRAHDTLLGRDVAVKIVTEGGIGTEGTARLISEAQAAAQLNHPNIVTIYDVGQADNTPFIVMEFVQGETLRKFKPQALEDTLEIIRQVCVALDHAHANQIIHRDLKPENVIITPSRAVKLMDFGLARSLQSQHLTQEGAIIGTPAYFAPEQLQGDEVDARSDLYALGVMTYELVTGELPFSGDLFSLISQHLHTHPRSPRELRPELLPHIESVILRLMEKNPQERFQTAGEVLSALAPNKLTERPTMTFKRPQHNLPVQSNRFIGRNREIGDVERLADQARMITLTGSGGVGKTRLALQAAQLALGKFPDGIWYVELAPLSDPALLPEAAAVALGVREKPNASFSEAIVEYLRTKELLLILDNCEHLIEASSRLCDSILRGTPKVKLLTTSREPLGIPGEITYRVPSLAVPETNQPSDPEKLAQVEAVQLFVERARAAQPAFALTNANAQDVAQICRKLDGIPLAIELAAARVKVFNPGQIAARLDDRFRLLTGGSRLALPRQQTLRAAIDWSYSLLSEPERVLLRRLSIFAGGWLFEAAEDICAGGGIDTYEVLDLLTSLVDKSLVVVEELDSSTRYGMLETIRQYALEKLAEAGETAGLRDRHLEHYMLFSEQVQPALQGPAQQTWLENLEQDHDNLRLALEWAQEKHAALNQARLAAALWRFWWVRSYFSEGRRWLETALTQDLPAELRVKCLYRAAFLANYQGDFAHGAELCQQCIELSEQASELEGVVMGHVGLIQVHMLTGKGGDGLHHVDPALNAAKQMNDRWLMGMVHFMAANAHLILNQHSPALEGYRQALALFNAIGDQWMIMNTQLQLIWTSFVMGVSDEAVRAAEVLGLCRSFGDKRNTARMLIFIGEIELKTNRPQTARTRLAEGIKLFHEIGEVFWGTVCLESFGRALVGVGEHTTAAAILGYTDQHYTRHKMPRLDYFQVEYQRAVDALQSTLPGPEWESARQQGQSQSWDEIVRFALASSLP